MAFGALEKVAVPLHFRRTSSFREATMKRTTALMIVAALLALPLAAGAAAGPIDGVPLMKLSEFKEVPGTLVAITPPARPRPCAPLLKGELTDLPGLPVPVTMPAMPCYIPVMTGELTVLPGAPVPTTPPQLPAARRR
jgi:hypothetical protein